MVSDVNVIRVKCEVCRLAKKFITFIEFLVKVYRRLRARSFEIFLYLYGTRVTAQKTESVLQLQGNLTSQLTRESLHNK